MSQIESWSFTAEQLSAFMQSVKNVIITDLLNNDLISDETYEIYNTRKFLVIRKPSFFTQMWRKVFTYTEDHDYIHLCTAETLSLREEEQPEEKPDLKVVPLTEKKSE